jgi:hypothetical protein
MLYAVMEEVSLFEVPLGSTDWLPSGVVIHGPYAPVDCGAVLSLWSARGWLTLHEQLDGGREIAVSDSHALDVLHSPDRWLPETRDGLLRLCRSDAGDVVSWEEWRAAASQRSV